MILLIISLFLGFIGLQIGGFLGSDIYIVLFGIVGFFTPSILALEKIYKNQNL